MIVWRSLLFWIGLFAISLTFGLQIWQKQAIINDGQRLLLPLRPADPRSLIQGDYMQLTYDDSIFPSLAMQQVMPPNGNLVLKINDQGVGEYERLYAGERLNKHEVRLHYRVLGQSIGRPQMKLATTSYFFPQGAARSLEDARFAVLHAGKNGDSVLIGLANASLKDIIPEIEPLPDLAQ